MRKYCIQSSRISPSRQFETIRSLPPAVPSPVAYALFDGLFQHALISHLAGSADAARDLERNVQHLLESLTVLA